MSLRVHWATDIRGIGNQYGFSVHDRESRRALARAGVELAGPAEAEIHVFVGPPHGVESRPGKRVVLYTAWEAYEMPPAYIEGLRKAAAILVPARFLVEVCERYTADLGTPVHYCPLGVDVETFTPPARKREPRAEGVFRWLWCGAPNARKGWDAVRALIPAFSEWGRMELYFKTTGPAALDSDLTRRRCREGLTVICDARNLSLADMASLYQGSHAFLYPTRGEGFGLTLAEAMATGLPCLYTPWSACTDLADASCGFPLRYRLERLELAPNIPATDPRYDRFRVTAAVPRVDLEHMAGEMIRVMARYRAARQRGLRAAERIQRRFTWQDTGARLRAILEKTQKEAARCPQVAT